MITILKLAGLSAVLSAGLVTGFSAPEQRRAAAPAKLFYDRVSDGATSDGVALASVDPRALVPVAVNRAAKGDRSGPDISCSDGAQRRVPADCMQSFDVSSAFTSEVRSHGNLSVLMRNGGAQTFASR